MEMGKGRSELRERAQYCGLERQSEKKEGGRKLEEDKSI